MRRAALAITFSVIAAMAVALAACDDEKKPEPSPTAGIRPTEPPDFASPTIEAGVLTSTEKGYRVRFPEGWQIRPNFAYVGSESIDTAFLNQDVPSGAVRPTLTIGCFPKQPDGEPNAEEFTQNRLSAIRAGLGVEPELGTRQVAGETATTATYVKDIQVDNSAQVDRIRQQDVFLVGPLCALTLSLLSSPEDEAVFQPQFDALLASFELLP